MKKLEILTLLPIFLLGGCNSLNPYGTYEFRLGKTDGNHLEVSATLSDQDYEKVEGMKKMTLTADLGEDFSITKVLEDYGEQYPLFEELFTKIIDKIKDITEIEMYYKVLDIVNDKYGNRLAIGSDFLTKLVKEIVPDIETILNINAFNLTPEFTEQVFVAYINNKNLTFQIPVSLDDLRCQLIWYGKYFDEDYTVTNLDLDLMPGKKDELRYGTHPEVRKDDYGVVTYSEVDMMNDIFKKEFSNTYYYVKDAQNIETRVGRLYNVVGEVNQLYLYRDPEYSGSLENLEGYVYMKDLLGEYSDATTMKLSVGDNGLTNVTSNEKEDKEAGIIDTDGTEFEFRKFMKAPFTFRDFHDVKLALAKK